MRLSFATQDRRPRRERIHDRVVGSAKKDPKVALDGNRDRLRGDVNQSKQPYAQLPAAIFQISTHVMISHYDIALPEGRGDIVTLTKNKRFWDPFGFADECLESLIFRHQAAQLAYGTKAPMMPRMSWGRGTPTSRSSRDRSWRRLAASFDSGMDDSDPSQPRRWRRALRVPIADKIVLRCLVVQVVQMKGGSVETQVSCSRRRASNMTVSWRRVGRILRQRDGR